MSSQQTYNNPYDLNPLSYASTIIGFISFVFTLLTLLRVIWGNIIGLWEAPDEIRYAFANLKSALLEERAHCRVAWRSIITQLRYERDQDIEDRKMKRRHSSRSGKGHRRRKSGGKSGPPYTPTLAEAGAEPYGSDLEDDGLAQEKIMARAMDAAANWKVLYGTVKRLCKQFSEIEQPFLRESVRERQQKMNKAWQQDSAREKAAKYSDLDSDEEPGMIYDEASIAVVKSRNGHYMTDDYLRDYVSFDFRHRVMWLRVRSRVNTIGHNLETVQIRRASAEITQILRAVATVEAGLRDLRLIQDQRDHGQHHGRSSGERRREGERWERVHVRRSIAQDD